MAVKCDGCGSEENVRRAFMTMWNGNIYDLCKICLKPIAELTDKVHNGEGAGSGKG